MTGPAASSPSRAEDLRAGLAMALLRLVLVPLVGVARSVVDTPGPDSDLFVPLLIVVGVYATVLVVVHVLATLERLDLPPGLTRAEPVADLLAIAALTYTSGGPNSETRLAFLALPLVAAFRLRPALTAVWSAAAVLVYVLLSLPHPTTKTRADIDAIIVHALFLAWTGAGAVVLSAVLGRRDARIRAAADERGRLVAQALTAEERERRRLAELLHDDAIQNLLLARQELRDHHRRHDEESYARADAALQTTVEHLRSEIFQMHPYVLEHAGLRAALTAQAESAARRAGAHVEVDVPDDAAAAGHEQLVLALARELLFNAASHAQARAIRLGLTRDDGQVVLVVADDGRGFAPARRTEALAEGHIGLATTQERVAAAGGTLDVDSAPGAGTTVTVRLPGDGRGATISP